MRIRPVKTPKSPQEELAELENRLPSDSPVRRWRQQESPTGEDLVYALDRCRSNDWISHAVAYHHLRHVSLSPSDRKTATRILNQTLEKPVAYGPEPRGIRLALAAVFLFALARQFYPAIHRALMPHHISDMMCCTAQGFFDGDPFPSRVPWVFRIFVPFLNSSLITLISYPFIAKTFSVFDESRKHRLQRAAAETLGCIGDAGSISALTLHVRRQTPTYDQALNALKKILPTVTPDEYGQVPAETTPALLYLAESFDPEIALLALDALEKIGDSSSVLTVERMAAQTISPAVQERAAAILPALYARRSQENAAATLLRAGSQPGAEELVRPVYGGDPDVTNLLRASQVVEAHE